MTWLPCLVVRSKDALDEVRSNLSRASHDVRFWHKADMLNALDRLVTAGKIKERDRDRATFTVRTIAHPPERPALA